MSRRRHTPEQIITALREAEVGLANGKTVVLAAAQNYTEVAGENVTLGGPVVRAARRRV